jgi:hypothetical protein
LILFTRLEPSLLLVAFAELVVEVAVVPVTLPLAGVALEAEVEVVFPLLVLPRIVFEATNPFVRAVKLFPTDAHIPASPSHSEQTDVSAVWAHAMPRAAESHRTREPIFLDLNCLRSLDPVKYRVPDKTIFAKILAYHCY